jgi:hypothetical protein
MSDEVNGIVKARPPNASRVSEFGPRGEREKKHIGERHLRASRQARGSRTDPTAARMRKPASRTTKESDRWPPPMVSPADGAIDSGQGRELTRMT